MQRLALARVGLLDFASKARSCITWAGETAIPKARLCEARLAIHRKLQGPGGALVWTRLKWETLSARAVRPREPPCAILLDSSRFFSASRQLLVRPGGCDSGARFRVVAKSYRYSRSTC